MWRGKVWLMKDWNVKISKNIGIENIKWTWLRKASFKRHIKALQNMLEK